MTGQFASSFLAGLLASATPCVYPLIPVTIAVLGARDVTSRWAALGLSSLYVLGLAMSYTALGIITALSGEILGSTLGNPWIVFPIAALFTVFALSSLDLLQIGFFCTLQCWAAKLGGKGWRGALIMGMVSGIVAAPCVGPVVAGILYLAAKSQDPTQGALLLFTFSLGLGLPFLILGTFSTLLSKLPKSGPWLKAVKYAIAVGLLFVVCTLLAPFIGLEHTPLQTPYTLLFCILSSALLGGNAFLSGSRGSLGASAFLASLVLFLLVGGAAKETTRNSEGTSVSQAGAAKWLNSLPEALHRATKSGRPVMLDLFAEWCTACKELRRDTFPDSQVSQLLKEFVLAEVDFTEETPLYEELTARYSIVGLPTILFLHENGDEIANSRVTGFLPAPEFAAHLRKVLAQK